MDQKSLYEEVEGYFESFQSELLGVVVEEEGHGRVEWREYFWRQIRRADRQQTTLFSNALLHNIYTIRTHPK